VDPAPARVSNERTVTMFELFAELIALQLDSEDWQQAAESALSCEKETSVLRERFIAVLGHDLRGPLSAVGMTGEFLIRRQVHLELVQMGMRLGSAARRMGRLIDDVLDFARGRMGSGMGVVLAEAENLALSLREVLVEMRTAPPERDLRDHIDIDVLMVCDQTRIQQLLSNLVGNAVAHSAPETPVEIKAWSKARRSFSRWPAAASRSRPGTWCTCSSRIGARPRANRVEASGSTSAHISPRRIAARWE
jgi:signal transduction histidine kinase